MLSDKEKAYTEINKKLWNKRTDYHIRSDFYDVDGFLSGKNFLNSIELDLLGNISGKRVLHLQCHFGMDTLSLNRLGAEVTGIDLSEKAIEYAVTLTGRAGLKANFICCDVYDLPEYLDEKYDIVFTSYGTIGWLPDLERWAAIVSHFLKPGGKFVFAEFHPVVWMFDNDFNEIPYSYFNTEAIIETEANTYADSTAEINLDSVSWNHHLGEVISSLLKQGLRIASFEEYDYSPYNCFKHTIEAEKGKFRIKHLNHKIPMVYSLSAIKP